MEPLGRLVRLIRVQMPGVLRKLALEHDGVVTIDAALDAGMSRSSVYRRVRAGEWRSHGNGVYSIADHPQTARTRLRVETLIWVSPRSCRASVRRIGTGWPTRRRGSSP